MSEQFMVSVDGRSAPSKVHENYAEATQEALRLSQQPCNKGSVIRVLKVMGVLEPTHKWKYIEQPRNLRDELAGERS